MIFWLPMTPMKHPHPHKHKRMWDTCATVCLCLRPLRPQNQAAFSFANIKTDSVNLSLPRLLSRLVSA
eukprot:m.528615 g.528615  ORF g.528615 m.528615 type:complete len:68 (-) comp57561_c0_seq15:1232-1435(-)